jgi:hypothetical protein
MRVAERWVGVPALAGCCGNRLKPELQPDPDRWREKNRPMTIKFICGCGKHLRARDEMASRRSVCPRCGSPVGVPSLRPALPGALGPMTPDERRQARKSAFPTPHSEVGPNTSVTVAGVAPPQPLDPESVQLVLPGQGQGQSVPEVRQLSIRWGSRFLELLPALPCLFLLSHGLALLTGIASLALPGLWETPTGQWWMLAICSLGPLLLPAYACGFLYRVLVASVAGGTSPPGTDLALALRGAIVWLICFLAGPVVPVVGGFLYWLRCGDPDLLDVFILAELAILGVGSWVLLLLAVSQRGRLRDANPWAVILLVWRVGDRLAVGALMAGLAALGHGWLLLVCLEEFHRHNVGGGLLLAVCWFSGLLWAMLLFQLLGLWCHQADEAA